MILKRNKWGDPFDWDNFDYEESRDNSEDALDTDTVEYLDKAQMALNRLNQKKQKRKGVLQTKGRKMAEDWR